MAGAMFPTSIYDTVNTAVKRGLPGAREPDIGSYFKMKMTIEMTCSPHESEQWLPS